MSAQEEESSKSPSSKYRLRSSSPRSPKIKNRYVSPLRRTSPEVPKSPTSGSSKGKLVSPPITLIQELKNLYCCNIPNDLMNRDLLRDHFSQFGQVIRIYLSVKKNSCTVHFKTHEAAKVAKLKGSTLKGYALHIFWSKPATKSEKGIVIELQHSVETSKVVDWSEKSKEQTNRQDSQEKRSRSSSHQLRVNDLPSERTRVRLSKRVTKHEESKTMKEKEDLYLRKKKYELPDEVAEELKAMSESDDYETYQPAVGTGNGEATYNLRSSLSICPAVPSAGGVQATRRRKILPIATTTTATTSASATLREPSLKELLELWQFKCKMEFHSAEECYQILELRDKILRIRRGKQSDLSKAEVTRGTCQDMCPEKERYQRESQRQISFYEQTITPSKDITMNHALAVKQYSRSSADQEEPLPHELRPTPVLRMTMDYLLTKIMDRCDYKDENLGEWYHFLWDRTRGIRKDITQQELCDKDAVNLVEECVRFHIHCSERLVAEKTSVFDSKINSENLTKCLQTLKYLYHDMALKDVNCENEAEFRGYIILLNLNDSNFLWEIKELREEIVLSEPVRFAMEVSTALNSNNYLKFFKLVKKTTYLNACILLRYFYQIRSKALHIILKSHGSGSKQAVFSLGELTRLLAFENVKEAAHFCNHHGLHLRESGTELIIKDKLKLPSHQLPMARAIKLIESKRKTSVGETIKGGPLTTNSFETYMHGSSFNPNGTLKEEVVNLVNGQSFVQRKSTLQQQAFEQGEQFPTPEQAIEWEEVPVSEPDNINVQPQPIMQQETSAVEEMEASASALDDVKTSEENEKQKQLEMERLQYQMQAIEEAECQKCDEMLCQMVREIIDEEFDVFCERLDNVAILDLDEILLDVMCNMTRDVFKEVVAEEEEKKQKIEEAERKRKEEEEKIRKEEEEKRRKLIEEIAQQTTEEIVEEIVTTISSTIVQFETTLHNASVDETNEIVESTIKEETESILEDAILKSKLEYLAERRRQYCCKKYFNLWRKAVKKMKEKRRSMEDFPAWFAPLTAEQQVERLGTLPRGAGTKRDPLIIPPRKEELITDLKFFDIVALNLIILRPRKSPRSKYYKLVVSLPDEEESPKFSKYYERFVDIAFPETEGLEMESPPHLLERKSEQHVYALTVSMRKVLGPQMLEKGIPNEDAVSGMNGLLFVVSHGTKDISIANSRLHQIITQKKHYGEIPVAVLLSESSDESVERIQFQLDLLCNVTGININIKYFVRERSHLGLSKMFVTAVDWLAAVHDLVPTPYCSTAWFMMNASLRSHLWEKFIYAEVLPKDDLDRIKLNLFMAIKIHNRACRELCKLVTDDEVNSCTIGAPEFAQYRPVHELHEAGYTVMPKHYGSPEYKQMIVELFRSVEFIMPPRQHLENKWDLDRLLGNLCLVNKISEKAHEEIQGFYLIKWCDEKSCYLSDCKALDVSKYKSKPNFTETVYLTVEDEKFVNFKTKEIKANPSSLTWVIKALSSFSWGTIIKYMTMDRLSLIDFMDKLHNGPDEHPILVAANRKKLDQFVKEQWYIFVREGDQFMSRELFTLWHQFDQEKDLEPTYLKHRGIKRKRTSYEGFPEPKHWKDGFELPDIETISNMKVGISEEEKKKFLICKAKLEELMVEAEKCVEAQKALDDKIKQFFE